MKNCSNCKTSCPENSRFCLNCGISLLRDDSATDELKLISILFADISGFTSFSERFSPDEVKEMVSELFKSFSKIVESENGTVIKYEGDCIMAVFGYEKSSSSDALHSCHAALKIREAMHEFRKTSEVKDYRNLEIRIGLHTGTAVKCLIGGRKDVIGDAVNLAARMEQSAPPGKILVTYEHAVVSGNQFEMKFSEEIPVKGKTNPVSCYILEGRKCDYAAYSEKQFLTGRDKEIELCCSEYKDSVNKRKSGIMILEGTAGVGKTSIIRSVINSLKKNDSSMIVVESFYDKSVISEYRFLKSLVFRSMGVTSRNDLISRFSDCRKSWNELDYHAEVLEAVTGMKDSEKMFEQKAHFKACEMLIRTMGSGLES